MLRLINNCTLITAVCKKVELENHLYSKQYFLELKNVVSSKMEQTKRKMQEYSEKGFGHFIQDVFLLSLEISKKRKV